MWRGASSLLRLFFRLIFAKHSLLIFVCRFLFTFYCQTFKNRSPWHSFFYNWICAYKLEFSKVNYWSQIFHHDFCLHNSNWCYSCSFVPYSIHNNLLLLFGQRIRITDKITTGNNWYNSRWCFDRAKLTKTVQPRKQCRCRSCSWQNTIKL